eukprot:TRINITY_DN22780_c0_g1_i1.p1 TRINITY_DN22780_c0_g1~~TRINITY_DN22780_c0_g1_i1.p1  ORF type:complete len:120 (+),score=22.66 TRINITY_DN22780_c0_g1_i1:133-492(+)
MVVLSMNAYRGKLLDDFETFTKILDWELVSGIHSLKEEYNYLETSPLATQKRVQNMMDGKENGKTDTLHGNGNHYGGGSRVRHVDEETYKEVCLMSARLFAGIRFFFVKYIRNKMNAFF